MNEHSTATREELFTEALELIARATDEQIRTALEAALKAK